MTFSDVFTWGIYGSTNAFIALFLETRFGDSTLEIVGIGVGIFTLTKAVFQIPFGIFVDKMKTTYDEPILLFIGNLLMGIPFLFFPLINEPSLYFVLQFFLGLGAAANLLSWRKLFATNLDKDREGSDYAAYEFVFSLISSAFSPILGFVAGMNNDYFGFVIIMIGVLVISSSIWPLMVFRMKRRKFKEVAITDKK